MQESSIATHCLAIDEILSSDSEVWKRLALEIGRSRERRPILGIEIGKGTRLVSLIGGCHADEPVGPAMLERLAGFLIALPVEHPLRKDFSWRIVPHVNPDGEVRNRSWTRRPIEVKDHLGRPDHGYHLGEYLRSVVRELPGDDIEFGFPGGCESSHGEPRPENLAVAAFLSRRIGAAAGRIVLHGSLHGMGLAPGPWFLLERSWIERTAPLRRHLAAAVGAMGYRLFDAERNGAKGFHRIEPGFATRPDSLAMRQFFQYRGEDEVARKFRPSSMEFARAHGNDPLTLVTEMPLFLVSSLPTGPVERQELERVRSELILAAARGGEDLAKAARGLRVAPMAIRDQMRLQLAFLDQALGAIGTPLAAGRDG